LCDSALAWHNWRHGSVARLTLVSAATLAARWVWTLNGWRGALSRQPFSRYARWSDISVTRRAPPLSACARHTPRHHACAPAACAAAAYTLLYRSPAGTKTIIKYVWSTFSRFFKAAHSLSFLHYKAHSILPSKRYLLGWYNLYISAGKR
jgi:hypothetical protein